MKDFNNSPLGDLYIHKGVVTSLAKKGNVIKQITLTTAQGIKGKNVNKFYKVEAEVIVPLDPITTSAKDLYDILIAEGTSQKKAKSIVGKLA